MTRGRRSAGLFVLTLLLTASTLSAQLPQALLELDARVSQLAAEAAARGPAMPIPLLSDGSRQIGAVYDQYLLGIVIARQLMASGQSVNPSTITAHPLWRSRGVVIVAYPIDCEGRANHPLAIRWKPSSPVPAEPQLIGEPLRGSSAQSMLPGIALPDDALVVNLRNAFMVGAVVEMEYAEPVCHGGAKTATVPVTLSPSGALVAAFNGIKLPEAQSSLPSPTTVHVRLMLDVTGRARFPEQVDGPPELGPIALDLLNARPYPPATTNGVPTPFSTVVPFVFTKTGERATAAPYRPVPSGGVTMTTGTPVATPATASTPPPVLPAPPPGEIDLNFARVAIEVAQKGDPTPVPLDAAGPPIHGVLFDKFLVAAVKARAAILAGKSLDASTATPDLLHEDMVIVAYALACDGRKIMPVDVELWAGGSRPGPVAPTGSVLNGDPLHARLPGARIPDGAIGKTFSNALFSQNLEARLTYAETPCGATTKTLTLPIQWTRGTSIRRLPFAKLPAESTLPSPIAMQMRGMVDLDGAYRFPVVADGPAELAPSAITIAAEWRYQPYRANGVAVPQTLISQLTFTTSGGPEGAPPAGAPAVPRPTENGAPPVMTSSTLNGRSEEMSTTDAAGLTARSSLCSIANTSTYGVAAAAPIRTGGGPAAGPSRERQYLNVLRGPSGQGLHITRRGSMLAPDGQTILDVYEITYDGLASPLRLFLDEYHDGVLQAPQGLVCAAPIVIR